MGCTCSSSACVSTQEAQCIEVAQGKARDFELCIALAEVTLLGADIEDVWLTVKANADDADADALIAKRLGAGIALLGPLDSTEVLGLVSFTNADTAALAANCTYFLDVQVKPAARGPDQAAWGWLYCRGPVTVANT